MNLKILIYCTKAKCRLGYLCKEKNGRYYITADNGNSLNGKIVAECDFEVEEITNCGTSFMIMKYDDLHESYIYTSKVAKGSQLNFDDLKRYLGTKNGYAIHIKNLHIFDKPKELNEYMGRTEKLTPIAVCKSCTKYSFDCKKCPENYEYYNLTKAPQNMCYAFDCLGNKYVIISVRPEWLMLILNGYKTIEVRRKVLKELL